MLLTVNLIIGTRLEVGVWQGVLGIDDGAEVGRGRRKEEGGRRRDWGGRMRDRGGRRGEEGRRRKEVRMDIKEFAHLLTDGLIEVNEVLPIVLGKEGTQVVLVIFKERRLAIGRLQSLPMQVTPVAVGGNPGQFTMHSARFTVWLRVVTTHRQL